MSGQWSSGLFGCMVDVMQCVDTWFCALCAMSRQWKAIEGQTDTCDVTMCVAAWCCPLCVNIAIRVKVVEKYSIDEAKPVSCCTAWICGQCSLCQTHRELSMRNAWPGGTICHKQPTDYNALK